MSVLRKEIEKYEFTLIYSIYTWIRIQLSRVLCHWVFLQCRALSHTVAMTGTVLCLAKHRVASPCCCFRGGVDAAERESVILCWSQEVYRANTHTGSYHNHINMPVARPVLLHSTSETTQSKKTEGGLTVVQTQCFLLLLSGPEHALTTKQK